MKRVLEWVAIHGIEILIMDLPKRVGARYYEDWGQVVIARGLDELQRLTVLRQVVADAQEDCTDCRTGAHLGGSNEIRLPIGCPGSCSCVGLVAVGMQHDAGQDRAAHNAGGHQRES